MKKWILANPVHPVESGEIVRHGSEDYRMKIKFVQPECCGGNDFHDWGTVGKKREKLEWDFFGKFRYDSQWDEEDSRESSVGE